jgi:adenosylhomocysteine nucleosidase
MKIVIITAMPEEFRAVALSLRAAGAAQVGAAQAGRFRSATHEFLVGESGMGFGNAARATKMLIDAEQPDLLISAGFCGGIAPELHAGDVVVAEKIIIVTDDVCQEIPVQFSRFGAAFIASQSAEGRGTVGGTFVSTSAITSKSHLAGVLSGHHFNPVVEMESGAIAVAAAENNIPLLAIRTVSDSAAEELGFTLEDFCDAEMLRIRPGKVLFTVFRKPWIIPQLVRLARSSRIAAESLTAALSCLFPAL